MNEIVKSKSFLKSKRTKLRILMLFWYKLWSSNEWAESIENKIESTQSFVVAQTYFFAYLLVHLIHFYILTHTGFLTDSPPLLYPTQHPAHSSGRRLSRDFVHSNINFSSVPHALQHQNTAWHSKLFTFSFRLLPLTCFPMCPHTHFRSVVAVLFLVCFVFNLLQFESQCTGRPWAAN